MTWEPSDEKVVEAQEVETVFCHTKLHEPLT